MVIVQFSVVWVWFGRGNKNPRKAKGNLFACPNFPAGAYRRAGEIWEPCEWVGYTRRVRRPRPTDLMLWWGVASGHAVAGTGMNA